MQHQCEGRTRRGARCRCRGAEYRKVAYVDGIRGFLVCPVHAEDIRIGAFRPAVRRSPETA
jgi:hypothetical protein